MILPCISSYSFHVMSFLACFLICLQDKAEVVTSRWRHRLIFMTRYYPLQMSLFCKATSWQWKVSSHVEKRISDIIMSKHTHARTDRPTVAHSPVIIAFSYLHFTTTASLFCSSSQQVSQTDAPKRNKRRRSDQLIAARCVVFVFLPLTTPEWIIRRKQQGCPALCKWLFLCFETRYTHCQVGGKVLVKEGKRNVRP